MLTKKKKNRGLCNIMIHCHSLAVNEMILSGNDANILKLLGMVPPPASVAMQLKLDVFLFCYFCL